MFTLNLIFSIEISDFTAFYIYLKLSLEKMVVYISRGMFKSKLRDTVKISNAITPENGLFFQTSFVYLFVFLTHKFYISSLFVILINCNCIKMSHKCLVTLMPYRMYPVGGTTVSALT